MKPDASLMGERHFGLMLHSIDYRNGKPNWFKATMRDGIIDVPALGSKAVLS